MNIVVDEPDDDDEEDRASVQNAVHSMRVWHWSDTGTAAVIAVIMCTLVAESRR